MLSLRQCARRIHSLPTPPLSRPALREPSIRRLHASAIAQSVSHRKWSEEHFQDDLYDPRLLEGRSSKSGERRQTTGILTEKEAKKHLIFLRDPVKLAFKVKELLDQNKFESAEVLVRTACKYIIVTVSWNHLIDWQMQHGKANGAIKTFNEMKKRGQTPDAVTYAVLLRGLGKLTHLPSALAKALSIYQVMTAPNSPQKPNTKHTNAVLTVCSRAKDLDAMFSIAEQLPDRGRGAPDSVTFTIILDTIAHNATEGVANLTPEEIKSVKERASVSAREIWNDVVTRWRAGDLILDERVVCSLARVLLVGDNQDHDDVFALLKQAMNIPRLVPPLGTPEREAIDPSSQEDMETDTGAPGEAASAKIGVPESKDNNTVEHNAGEDPAANAETDSKKLVPRQHAELTSKSDGIYPEPTNLTLSVILRALNKFRLKRFATEYIQLFAKKYHVRMDGVSLNEYLRILRKSRSGAESVQALADARREDRLPAAFLIVSSAIMRDKNNANSVKTAAKLVELMHESLAHPEPIVYQRYLDLAQHGSLVGLSTGATPDQRHFQRGRQILAALNLLETCVPALRRTISYGATDHAFRTDVQRATVARHRRDALALMQAMIGAYDRLLDRGMVNRDDARPLIARRSRLAAFVTRHHRNKKRREAEGKLRAEETNAEETKASEED